VTNDSGRRGFITGLFGLASVSAFAWTFRRGSAMGHSAHTAPRSKPGTVKIVKFADDGTRQGVVEVPRVVKTDEEWRKQLAPQQFEVTRHAGTERAFTGALYKEHAPGLYRCICCDNALFRSETKFESGTGWPSFWAPIAKENISDAADMTYGMERDEVRCKLCDAHLGHVFDDGPKPTGLRYCMNSAALRFVGRNKS
jgi:peptide-methionine (R)-S-oxide reductase